MDVKTRIMIDKITEYVRKEYKIIGPISDIESIVVSMGGIIVEKTAIDDLSDIWIRKSGKESFEIFLPPVQISWTIERRNFMIAHELGHLFLHMGFRINDDKWNNQMKGFYRNNDAETNYQANEFAKAFLMPEEEYGEILNRYTKGNRVNIKEVANHFHVAINIAASRGQLLGYFEQEKGELHMGLTEIQKDEKAYRNCCRDK